MHVLMTDESTETSRSVARALSEAGHTVHSCRDGDHPGCVGLRGSRCPLDAAPVDLVVGTGTRGQEHADLRHEGVLCGARHRIALMFVGVPPDDLLPPWVPMRTVRSAHEAPEMAEQVARAPLPMHTGLATESLCQALERQGTRTRKATATVHRRDGGLVVEAVVPSACTERQREELAVALHGALREFDPWASTCDVRFA